MHTLRPLLVALVVAACALVANPAAHAAQSCSIGDSGITYNRNGVGAQFRALQARQGMNCASARYVLNRWLRRAYARRYSASIPTSFYDGYVNWSCWKRSGLRWECNEYDSGTTFRFTAVRL